jgi:tyrosyl-tRNA synthetase
MPESMPEVTLQATAEGLTLPHVLKQSGLTSSTSEALRMIDQGGVKLNGERVTDKALKLARGDRVVLQVGKRKFARVELN